MGVPPMLRRARTRQTPPVTLKTPILVVGGGTGGVAAALAIAESGGRCVLTVTTISAAFGKCSTSRRGRSRCR
ncbi:hypothetical protein EON77_05910 [bacterium]|nr:MAG: hypothetical protein EON77_05910 [bacterium]